MNKQEWKLDGCCIEVQDGAIICVGTQEIAARLRAYHQAAIAAEQEKVKVEGHMRWTADTVFSLIMSQEDEHLSHEAVADAHNAELAEVVETERQEADRRAGVIYEELRKAEQQLAAERESVN